MPKAMKAKKSMKKVKQAAASPMQVMKAARDAAFQGAQRLRRMSKADAERTKAISE